MLCVGYVGCEAFDVILYTGRTLTKLNYRVLIIDLSASGALLHSINHGMNLDSLEEMVNYRDINYIRKMPSKEELDSFQDGVVIINYGFNDTKHCDLECKFIIILVNTFPHITDKINELLKEKDLQVQDSRLLIRDVTVIDDVDRVKKEFSSYQFSEISYLYLDISDYESAIHCQLSQIIRFTKVSTGMKKYIMEQIHALLPQLTHHKIKKAMALARRGG